MNEVSSTISTIVTVVAIGGGVVVTAFIAFIIFIRRSQMRGS